MHLIKVSCGDMLIPSETMFTESLKPAIPYLATLFYVQNHRLEVFYLAKWQFFAFVRSDR